MGKEKSSIIKRALRNMIKAENVWALRIIKESYTREPKGMND